MLLDVRLFIRDRILHIWRVLKEVRNCERRRANNIVMSWLLIEEIATGLNAAWLIRRRDISTIFFRKSGRGQEATKLQMTRSLFVEVTNALPLLLPQVFNRILSRKEVEECKRAVSTFAAQSANFIKIFSATL